MAKQEFMDIDNMKLKKCPYCKSLIEESDVDFHEEYHSTSSKAVISILEETVIPALVKSNKAMEKLTNKMKEIGDKVDHLTKISTKKAN